MKKAIIFIFPFAFRFNDYEKFELNLLQKTNDIFAFELIDYLYPQYLKPYKNRVIHPNIFRFNDKKTIINKFNKIKNDYKQKNIYIINFVHNINLKSLFLNILIKKKFDNHIKISNLGQRIYNYKELQKNNNLKYFKYSIYKLINNKESLFNIKVKLFNYIYTKYNHKKITNYFVAGNYYLKNINKKKNNVNAIGFHTWDVSKTIINKRNINKKYQGNIIFIDYPDPTLKLQNNLYGLKNILKENEWFSQLNNFFQYIQKKLNKKIIICPHPLTRANLIYKKRFYNYEIVENKLMELIYNSDLVIHVGSTALSYAIIYKKPMLLIYNNLLKNNIKGKIIEKMSYEIGSKLINIETDDYNRINHSNIMQLDRKKYEKYKFNYLSSNDHNIANFEILSNWINK